ncbi:hypothetical protein N7539_007167 [Penicillium diatomitis]|uniref:RING-type domain-containing protein n=1 Tax=Penicillium diatomitis TaxID=2819901 RepID=A0A9X0BNR9_9EURO|nr:uncharacterized protein N7539_007167 [Penicillium diatomitis]KAJ5477023.1 hypothetical protein N7539_007167 [Penicillium diatomitis]
MSAAGPSQTASKAVNTPNTSTPSSSFHSTGSTEHSGHRRSGAPAAFGSNSSSKALGTARNNQARKGQHKRQRKPRLLDDDEFSESAVMRSASSRKGQTSITHLMNFSLPPRPQYQPPPRNARRYQSWGAGSGYHAADKARYVHANYRFIVSPDQNYHAQAANADVHLDWASVLQVLVSAQTQAASCPICLSTPVAPRMARCGHIFCLPCLIRYMHSSDDETHHVPERKPRWKKCPICWDSIYASDARPVRWFRGQEGDLPVEGGDVILRLVKREPGSTLALPRDGAETLTAGDDIPWFHVAEVADYSRIMKGGQDYMVSQYDAEIEDLRQQEIEDELMFGDENTWTRKAIGAINEAKEKLRGIGNPPDISRQPPASKGGKISVSEPHKFDTAVSNNVERSGAILPDERDTTSTVNVTPAALAEAEGASSAPNGPIELTDAMNEIHLSSKLRSETPNKQAKDSHGAHPADQPYYFYQALPQFYLSPLDIRILKAAFGDYASFPATILPRVEHISTGHIVDDELRKRVKYLGHLPHGCEVNFLECDWRDVVVPEVLSRFRTETEKRRKRNRDKEAREEKDRIRAEKKEEEERWAAARRKRPSFGSASEAPFSTDDFQPLTSHGLTPPFDPDSASASPPRVATQFGALASPSSSPPGSRTVWGTTAIAPTTPLGDIQRAMPHDGWLQGWEDELFARQESEIMAQSAQESQTTAGPSSSQGGPGNGAGGKKKKKNKITLMSTNSHRAA